MAALATREPGATAGLRFHPRRAHGRLFEPGRASLDDRVSVSWQRLVEEGSADCLVCGVEAEAGDECPGCGSELS